MSKKLMSLLFLCFAAIANAQDMMAAREPEMADQMREDGKIWIVVTVIGMIFLALVIFMVRIERKIKQLENKIK